MQRFGAIPFFIFLMTIHSYVKAQEVQTMTTEDFLEEVKQMEEGTVLINFWATWCGPCVEELPYFNQLAQEYKESGLKVMFVSLDFKEATVMNFLSTHEFEGEVIFLSNGLRDPDWIEKVSPAWSGAIPATLALKHETEGKAFHEGSFTYEELLAWLSPAFISSN